MAFNSSNHGGRGAGDGQNVYFADGHVDFESTPIVGVDHDNIYTAMAQTNEGAGAAPRISGSTPQGTAGTGLTGPGENPYPGQGVFGEAANLQHRATTDSLIWP